MSPRTSRARMAAARIRRRLTRQSPPPTSAPAAPAARSGPGDPVVEAGIVDLEWYAFETGTVFASPADAVSHYRSKGARRGLSLHPLFVSSAIPDVPADLTALDALMADPDVQYAASPFPGLSVGHHAWLDAGAAEHPYGAWGALVERLDAQTDLWLDHPDPPVVQVPWSRLETVWRDLVAEWNRAKALAPAGARAKPPAAAPPRLPAPDAQPLVSVLVVAGECDAKDLRRALESVQRQTWSAWELVVADDGRGGDRALVVEALADRDRRIRVLPVEPGSAAGSLNQALAAARGEYVAFIDADHVWEPRHLESVVATMEPDGLPAAFGVLASGEGDAVRYRTAAAPPGTLLHQDRVELATLVVRAAVAREAGGFDEALTHGYGRDFTLTLSEQASLHLVPSVSARRPRPLAADADDPALAWADVVRVKHLVDWDDVSRRDEQAGLVSFVLSIRSATPFVFEQVQRISTALQRAGRPWEVVVVDHSVGRNVAARVAVLIAGGLPVRYVRLPSLTSFAVATDVGAARTSGEFVIGVDDDIALEPHALQELVTRLAEADGPVLMQPVTVDLYNVVVTAGAVFGPRHDLPAALLGGHLAGDVTALGRSPFALPAADGVVFGTRRRDLVEARGLDPLFDRELALTDYGLRLRAAYPDAVIAVVPEAQFARRVPERDPHLPGSRRRAFAARHAAGLTPTDPRLWERWQARLVGWERPARGTYALRPVLAGHDSGARDPALRWAWVGDRLSPDLSVLASMRSIATALTDLGDVCTVHRGPTAAHPRDELVDVIVTVGSVATLPAGGQFVTARWSDPERDAPAGPTADLTWDARAVACSTLPSADPAPGTGPVPSAGRLLVTGDPGRWPLFRDVLTERPVLMVGEAWRYRTVDEPGAEWIPWPRDSGTWADLVRAADEVVVLHDLDAEADGAICPAAVDVVVLRGRVLSNVKVEFSWSRAVATFSTPAELTSRLTETPAVLDPAERADVWAANSPALRAGQLRETVMRYRTDQGMHP